jgi:hypothetical protein
MHEALAVILTSIGTAIAAAGTSLAQIPVSAFDGPAIYDNDRLRVICIIGALGGAVLNLGLYPSKEPGIRPMVWKVTGSAVSGVVFTPVAIHWLGITPNIDNLLAVSFVMAIVSVGLLRKAIPVWMWVLGNKLGLDGNGGANGSDAPPMASGSSSQTNNQPPPATPAAPSTLTIQSTPQPQPTQTTQPQKTP